MSNAENAPSQPMGPLEEGDQALIDAMHRLEPGDYRRDQTEMSTLVEKRESPYGHDAFVRNDMVDGSSERIAIDVSPSRVPGTTELGSINAHTITRGADSQEGHVFTSVIDNRITAGLGDKGTVDREQAQALKLKIAQKVDNARERLEATRVDDPALAQDMAEAEQPYQDTIAERNQHAPSREELTGGDKMTGMTLLGLGGVALANERDAEQAQTAAETVRRERAA
jgi:hypothetical protein